MSAWQKYKDLLVNGSRRLVKRLAMLSDRTFDMVARAAVADKPKLRPLHVQFDIGDRGVIEGLHKIGIHKPLNPTKKVGYAH